MAILSNRCVITSQCLQLCKQNLYQLFIYLLSITEWAYKFLIPKICPVLGSFWVSDHGDMTQNPACVTIMGSNFMNKKNYWFLDGVYSMELIGMMD